MESSITPDQLKELIKTALVEALEQRQDLLQNAIEEALDALALACAIREGKGTEIIGRGKVFNLLN